MAVDHINQNASELLAQVQALDSSEVQIQIERKRRATSTLEFLVESLNDIEIKHQVGAIKQLYSRLTGKIKLDDHVIIVAQTPPEPDTAPLRLVVKGKTPMLSICIQKHSRHPIDQSLGGWPTKASFNLGDEAERKNRHWMAAFESTIDVLANSILVDQLDWPDANSAKEAVEVAIQKTTTLIAEKLK